MKTLKIGDKVPAFSGTTHDGAAFSSPSLINLRVVNTRGKGSFLMQIHG